MRIRIGLALIAGLGAAPLCAQAAPAGPPPQTYRLSPEEIARIQAQAAEARGDTLSNAGPRDGRPHGEVSVGVGSNGYRSFSGVTEVPFGASSNAVLGFETGRFDAWRLRGRDRFGPYPGGAYGPVW
jgi:hypothetical protein